MSKIKNRGGEQVLDNLGNELSIGDRVACSDGASAHAMIVIGNIVKATPATMFVQCENGGYAALVPMYRRRRILKLFELKK